MYICRNHHPKKSCVNSGTGKQYNSALRVIDTFRCKFKTETKTPHSVFSPSAAASSSPAAAAAAGEVASSSWI